MLAGDGGVLWCQYLVIVGPSSRCRGWWVGWDSYYVEPAFGAFSYRGGVSGSEGEPAWIDGASKVSGVRLL